MTAGPAEPAAARTVQLPAVLSALPDVVGFAAALAAAAGLDDRDRYRLRLVLEELFTNVALHSDAAAAGTGEVELIGVAADGWVRVELVDRGARFDPVSYRDPRATAGADPARRAPGGYGLVLSREACDRMDYQRRAGENRTTVLIRHNGAGGRP